MRIRKGDTVKILYGRDSGKVGKVLKVDPKKDLIVVEGMNAHRKHVKGDGQQRKSEVITIIKPMALAKVMLVDQESGKSTRVKYEIKDGVKSRVSVMSGKNLDTGKKKEETTKKETKKKSAKKESTKKKPKKTTKSKSKSKK